jgi:hypothetical protein
MVGANADKGDEADTNPGATDLAIFAMESALGDLSRAAADPACTAALERNFTHLWAAKIRLDNLFETMRQRLADGFDSEKTGH